MMRVKLLIPNEHHKAMVLSYKEEFIASGDSMDGTAGLSGVETYEIWLEALRQNSSEETVKAGLVPASTYLCIDESTGRLVGMIDIRHKLNAYLLKIGGHIGYSVRKSERRKGYATEMLRLSLEVCKSLEIERVLVTCDKSNLGSSKTIVNNGGQLENEVDDDKRVVQRYWIDV